MSVPVVYDTMIFLQAASRPERTHATFRAIQEGRVSLILSPELLAEVQDVLTRDSIRAKFPALTTNAVNAFVADVLARGFMLSAVPRAFAWPRHASDDHVFNWAIYAQAKYLVTWETRILQLATDTGPAPELLRRLAPELAIITPKALADILRSQAFNSTTETT